MEKKKKKKKKKVKSKKKESKQKMEIKKKKLGKTESLKNRIYLNWIVILNPYTDLGFYLYLLQPPWMSISMANVEIAWKLVNHLCEEAAVQCNVEEEKEEKEKEEEEEKEEQVYGYENSIYRIKPWIETSEEWELPCIVKDMYYDNREGTVLQGFFPEIRRAWTLLDHTLLLWRFDKRDGQIWEHRSEEQPISAVGLLKPSPNFVEATTPQYLLVLANPLELLLFGVCCCSQNDQDPLTQVSVEKLVDYTTSSDGVTMTCIACTDKGRIFLAGNNGHMYELLYTVGSPCRLVCCGPSLFAKLLFNSFKSGAVDRVVEMVVDNERKILYARTHRGKIEAYFLGMNGESPIEKLGEVSILSNEPSVVCISPLSKLESKWSHSHLVVVLLDGSRMYLSTSSSANAWKEIFFGINNQPRTPDCLRLVTAKRPPVTPNVLSGDMKVKTACCSAGTLFMSHPVPLSTSSLIVMVGRDSSVHTQVGSSSTLRELLFTVHINGRMLFVADVLPTPDTAPTVSLCSQVLGQSYEKTCGILRGGGDLWTQHFLPKKKILLFSTTTVTELVFNRPIDILIKLLEEKDSRVSLNAFVAYFGADETAAMCLMLASRIICGVSVLDFVVRWKAIDVFDHLNKVRMPQLGGRTFVQVALECDLFRSAASKGLYLCASRLLYPIWNSRVMSKKTNSGTISEDGVVICRLSTDVMHDLESKIRSLRRCLVRGIDEPANERLRLSDVDANDYMECCRDLIQRSAEALFLLQIITRHNIPIFTKRCEESVRQSLLQLKFRQLVHSAEDDQIAKVLISATIERLSGSESIRELLLEGCPSYAKEAFFWQRQDSIVTPIVQVGMSRVNKWRM